MRPRLTIWRRRSSRPAPSTRRRRVTGAALELDPKSAAAELGLAHALARQEKLADAAPHFRQAAALDPKYRDYLLELAGLYEKNQTACRGGRDLPRVPGESPRRSGRWAQLMLESRQYTDAIPQLEAAYTKAGTEANRVALAKAYLFARQLEKATPLLDQAVAAEPGNYDLRMLYAMRTARPEAVSRGRRAIFEAAKLKPAEAQTWSDLAGMLYMMGSYPQALAAYDRARDLGQNTPGNWFFRAIILDKLKQLKPALEAYRTFLSLSQGKNPDQEFQARQRVENHSAGTGEALMRGRLWVAALAVGLALAGSSLRADLKQAMAEPNLEKRSQLALDNATAA